MKKNFMLLSVLLMSVFSFGQKTSFGIKAGVQSNTFVLFSEGGGSDTKYFMKKAGFHAGGMADIKFSENFSIRPELLFVSKGGILEQSGSKIEFNFLTIDLPINLLYNYNGFFIGAGPNLSYGLSAKGKSGGDSYDLFEDEGGLGGEFKRFEMGINGTLGFRFPNGITLGANISCGLTDSFDEDSGLPQETNARNNFVGFSFGYFFGK